jgi:large subunit ribosomal protein L29
MKAMQLREMNEVELKAKLEDNLEALQNLRFQQALQQLEDKTAIQKTKREIAQIKTVLNEHKLGIRVNQGEKTRKLNAGVKH